MEQTLYSAGIGLNNKTAPHRLHFGKGGVSAFEEATNVLISRTGEVVSRRGSSILEAGSFHSGWACDNGFYAIQDRDEDSALMNIIVNADGSIDVVGIASPLTKGAKCQYVDLAGKTYYTNGYERGVIFGGLSYDWQENDWTGPETTSEMLAMPTGEHIDILSGHMLVAVGDELFHSEHGLLNLVDNMKNRVRFESKITMVCAVQSGAYVSDEKSIYFLSNPDPNQWTLKKVLGYPAYGLNQELVDPSFLGLDTTQLSGLFATSHGAVIGLPDGTAINLIDKNVTLPTACGNGAIIIVDETTILQS